MKILFMKIQPENPPLLWDFLRGFQFSNNSIVFFLKSINESSANLHISQQKPSSTLFPTHSKFVEENRSIREEWLFEGLHSDQILKLLDQFIRQISGIVDFYDEVGFILRACL